LWAVSEELTGVGFELSAGVDAAQTGAGREPPP
jgi:hypothetical protein